MREFQLIDWIRQRSGNGDADVLLGIGDDAAVIRPPADMELVVSTDVLNFGIHFDTHTPAGALGHKALAVSLSDLAAMGATPRWALLSISLPHIDQAWLESFIDGFFKLASEFSVTLVGGDTCRGELAVGVTAMGLAQPGQALTRGGAQAGDLVVVSGQIGDAALALQQIEAGQEPSRSGSRALHKPLPRVALGSSLVGKATSCIDISDGLLADLGHVADASGCGAVIELTKLPASSGLMAVEAEQRWKLQLCGGDDYELCFSMPASQEHILRMMSEQLRVKLTVIGKMVEESGIRCMDGEGMQYSLNNTGYEHFR